MIVVTGANGQLGRAIVASVQRRVGTGFAVSVRDASQARDLAAQGIEVRQATYDDPASLDAAFAGADALLLMSGDAPIELRTRQQRAAVEAAVRADVGRIVYTSVQDAFDDASPFGFTAVHRDTEARLAQGPTPFTVLRNGLYADVNALFAPAAAATGQLAMPTGDGRVAFVARQDLADAAAAVLASSGHEGRTYVLTGPQAHGFTEVAAVMREALGREVAFVDATPEAFAQGLAGAGLPAFVVEAMTGMAEAIRQGRMATVSDDLPALIARPAQDGLDALRLALAAPPGA